MDSDEDDSDEDDEEYVVIIIWNFEFFESLEMFYGNRVIRAVTNFSSSQQSFYSFLFLFLW